MALRDQIRIMVVDDMSTSRGLITQALDAFGIRNVATAENGKQALTALATKPVHLVISDFNMPEMDGLQLLHQHYILPGHIFLQQPELPMDVQLRQLPEMLFLASALRKHAIAK